MQERPSGKALTRVQPATDILERADGFHIFMDMPGVDIRDLVLEVTENELRVTGKISHDSAPQERFTELEFGAGEYQRSFTLSNAVYKAGIKAMLRSGVLEVILPRAEMKPGAGHIAVESA